MSNRNSTLQKFGMGALPLLAGIVVAGVIITIALSFEGFSLREVWNALYDGAWAEGNKRARVATAMLPLLLCSTGLLLTFTAGLWNIGIEGQLMMGAVGAAVAAMFVRHDSRTLQVVAEILLAMCTGAGWALLVGVLKTRGGVNEIFGGVALNFVASLFTAFLISVPLAPERGGTGSRTNPFEAFTLLPATSVNRAFISYPAVGIAVCAFLLVTMLLYFTRFGLQLKAIGKSPASAAALGVPAERNIWIAMTMCGGMAGLAGALLVLTPPVGQLQTNASGGIGFLALLVVLLASVRPLLVPLIVFVFAFLNTGAQRVESSLQIDSSLVAVLQGILVLAVLLFDGVRQRVEAAQQSRAVAAEAVQLAEAAGASHETIEMVIKHE